MKRSLFRITAHLQLAIAIVLATGCTPTQPFFLNESPDLEHYLDTATSVEYPDVDVASLPEAIQSRAPLTIGNHDYEFWDLTLEECVSMALNNARFIPTTGGVAEIRQSIAAQFVSGSPEQFGSIYDVAIQQTTTQSIPLTTDGNGNRLLPRGAVRANQVGGVEDALAEFDAVASGFIDYSTTDRPQNVGAQNIINPQEIRAYSATQQAALSKRLATGGVATLRQQTLYSRNNTPLGINSRAVTSDWTSILEAQVQHPLSRNRGTYVNRIPVMLARLNEDISIAEFEAQIRNLVRDVEVAYWDLYLAYRNVASSIIGRNSAMATARFADLNNEAGTGTRQEVAQAYGQYYTFRARLEAALAGSNLPGDDRLGVYGRERALRELLGLAPTDGRLIRPIEEPSLARVEFDWEESKAQMLYLMPELRRTKNVIKQAELEIASAKNNILPEVNLSLLYRWVGFGDSLGPPEGGRPEFPAANSSSLASLASGDYQEAAVRLEFSQAVGVRREMARIRRAQLQIKSTRAYLEDAERYAVSLLSDAFAKTASHYQQVQSQAQRWQAAEQEVELRLLEYRKGLTPVNVVLQSQERQAEAQVNYYRALTEYNKSVNYVDFLKGTLLVNSNITLREGPWNSKAYCDALERARERAAGYKLQYGVTRPGVVSRGPVASPEAAAKMRDMSQSLDIDPSTMPSADETRMFDFDPGNSIPMIEDMPLNELGTPRELLAPPIRDSVPTPSVEGNPPMPIPEGDSVLNQPVGSSVRISDAQPSLVAPMSYETTINEAAGVTANSGAPRPVAKKQLPTMR
ncbi:MAG: TolC family protein [Planctomycetota bacterium]